MWYGLCRTALRGGAGGCVAADQSWSATGRYWRSHGEDSNLWGWNVGTEEWIVHGLFAKWRSCQLFRWPRAMLCNVRLVDYDSPLHNRFTIANQWTVDGHSVRRADMIVFVNGCRWWWSSSNRPRVRIRTCRKLMHNCVTICRDSVSLYL